MDLYMLMQQKLTSSAVKILYHIGAKEALLGWVSGLSLVSTTVASTLYIIYVLGMRTRIFCLAPASQCAPD